MKESTEEEEAQGAAILSAVQRYLCRFVAFPPYGDVAATLWAAHTWAVHSSFATTPRLALSSKEPGAAKTLTISLLALLTPNPEVIIDPTGPVAFIMLGSEPKPTVLFDEADRVWSGRDSAAKSELTAILNAGYKRGAMVPRARRDQVRKWPVFGPVAFGIKGDLPGTLADRSVILRMQKLRRKGVVEDFDMRRHEQPGRQLGTVLGAWVSSMAADLLEAWPDRPEGLVGRAKEIWDPLLAVADVAGGKWPQLAREAAEVLALGKHAGPLVTPGQQLMDDIRLVWPAGRDRLRSSELAALLRAIPGAGYGEMWPDDTTAMREMAALLPAGIEPSQMKVGGRNVRGYRRAQFDPNTRSQPLPATA